jgi:DNA-binding protein
MRSPNKLLVVAILLLAFGWLHSATITAPNFEVTPANLNIQETTPALIPAVDTTVYAKNIWLSEITLTNISAGTVTVTVQDKQTTPREVLSAVSIAAHTTYVIQFGSRYCPNGVSWSASSGTAVVGYLRGKRLGG